MHLLVEKSPPGEWRDKQEIAASIADHEPLDLSGLTQAERDTMRALLMKSGKPRIGCSFA